MTDAELEKLLTALRNARSMLNTVAECVTHDCEDCREHAAKHRDAIDEVMRALQSTGDT